MIAVRTLESCLELLIPTPEEFSIPEIENDIPSCSTKSLSMERKGTGDNSDDENIRRRETGIIDPTAHAVTITLKPSDYMQLLFCFKFDIQRYTFFLIIFVYISYIDFRKRVKKTEDNSAVIESANEQVKLIADKYLPKIKKWLQDIAKISSNIYYIHN